jgi:hypothetical protein
MKQLGRVLVLTVGSMLFALGRLGVEAQNRAFAPAAVPTGPVINEFVACNRDSLHDKDGESSDWLELFNPTDEIIDLDGWYLTDDLNDLEKWELPSVQLAPGGYRVIFASGKNERDPAGELHTSFSLRADGESLALVEPDGKTIASAYVDYPPQLVDISYGLSGDSVVSQTETVLLAGGAEARALIPTNGALGLTWTQAAFNDGTWLAGQTGVGYDYAGLIGLDVGAMRNVNQTVYVRIPFPVADVSAADKLILRMRYEDGFVAYLNGVEVVRAGAPAGPLAWGAGAAANRPDSDAVIVQEFDITAYKNALVPGTNVLAVQGLNAGLSSSDLLILPELVAVDVESFDLSAVTEGYLLRPTPGAANQSTLAQVGPAIRNVTENPPPPMPGQNLIVTAEIAETLAPVRSVNLVCRINYVPYGRELPSGGLPMVDDGTGADAQAGDGIYTAVISGQLYGPGDMVCWYVKAEDTEGHTSRDPLFPYPDNSPEYYGTVAKNPGIVSKLPILFWFTQNPAAASTRGGTRASVFFDGEFYDNIFVRQRGGATVGAGSKKFVFNNGQKFRFSDTCGRVKEFNFNQNGSDPSYLRQPLGFETHREAGCPSSLSFLMLSVLNRQVERVGIFVEQVDEHFLERNGLDPRGALYKFVQRSSITPVFNDINSGIEKKTRQEEDFSDIRAVVQGLNAPTAEQRRIFVFDSFNLPLMMDYLAARCLLQDTDDIRKNFYFYRDIEGSGEWSIFPWDKDWVLGVVGDGWIYTSHPFLGDHAHAKDGGQQWSVFLDVMYNLPETREMFLRRTRTVMDELLQPPSTPVEQRFFENRIAELLAPAKPHLGNIDGAVNSLKAYFPPRRTQLYVDHNVNNKTSQPVGGNAGIPDAQPEDVTITFGACEYNPPSGNQDEEYIELVNPNSYAVDISDWQLVGGVRHAFLPGTVLIAGGRLYVSPNPRAFRSRTTSPKGGEGRFVQGSYKGHLSSWGEMISLVDRSGQVVDTFTYVGSPSDQQQFLRITEVMYNPAPGGAFDNDDYEFIELKNIGSAPLTLDGVKLTDGISYAFPATGSPSLAAGACIVLVKNRAAFTSRYPGNVNLAPGTYTGSLDNGGETIKLEDQTNSTILEFKYKDGWFSKTDGLGCSLTIKDPANPDLDSWNNSTAWCASTQQGGSPGL